jgi:hypothetical protein
MIASKSTSYFFMPLTDSFKTPRSPIIAITNFSFEEDTNALPIIRRNAVNPFGAIGPDYIPPPSFDLQATPFVITPQDTVLPTGVERPASLNGGIYGGSRVNDLTTFSDSSFSSYEISSSLTFGTLPSAAFGFTPYAMFWVHDTFYMIFMNTGTTTSDPFYRRLCLFKMTSPWTFVYHDVAGIKNYVTNSFTDLAIKKTATGLSVFWRVAPVAFGTAYTTTTAWNATGVVRIEFNDNGSIATYFEPDSNFHSAIVTPVNWFLDAATDDVFIVDNTSSTDISFRGVRWGGINVYNRKQVGSGFPIGGGTITPQVNGYNRDNPVTVWTENLTQPNPQTESIRAGTDTLLSALFVTTGNFTFEEISQQQNHDGSTIYRLRTGTSGTPTCANIACSSSLPPIAVQIIRQPDTNDYNISAFFERPNSASSGTNFLWYWGQRLQIASAAGLADKFGNVLTVVNSPATMYLAKSKTIVRLDTYNGGVLNVNPPIISTVKLISNTPYGFALLSASGSTWTTAQKKLRFFTPT